MNLVTHNEMYKNVSLKEMLHVFLLGGAYWHGSLLPKQILSVFIYINLYPSQLILSLMQIDCDKCILVTMKHDDKLQDGSECAFQVLT